MLYETRIHTPTCI